MFSIRQSLMKKWVSLCLAAAMTATMPGMSSITALAAETKNDTVTYSNNLAGWSVESVWTRSPEKNEATDTYSWHATTDTMLQPKVVTTYRLENPTHDYPKGSIIFTIPGIGKDNRASIINAYDYPGKDTSSTSEWKVSWNQQADVYTFTNDFEVKQGSSVSGGFEVVWNMKSRESVNDYSQTESPTFELKGVPDAGKITLPPLKYSFTSTPDNYRIYMTDRTLTGPEYDDVDHDTYIWHRISTKFDLDWKARGLYKSTYKVNITLPDGVDQNEILVTDESGDPYTVEKQDDGNYAFYPFKDYYGKSIGNRSYTYYENFYIGFKKDTLLGKNVTVKGHLDRLYNDDSKWTTTGDGKTNIVDTSVSFGLTDYGFNHSGFIYDSDKWTLGGYERSTEADGDHTSLWYENHKEPVNVPDRLNSTKLYQDAVVEFAVTGEAHNDYSSSGASAKQNFSISEEVTDADERISNALMETAKASVRKAPRLAAASLSHPKTGAPNATGTSKSEGVYVSGTDKTYSMIIGDDKMAIVLNNGTLRPLADSEYDFSYVTIPGDKYGYGYEVYGSKQQDPVSPKNSAGNFVESYFDHFDLIATGNTQNTSTVKIPDGYKSVFVRINGVKGTYVKKHVTFGVKYHFDAEAEAKKESALRINPDGKIVNFSFFRAVYTDGDEERNDCGMQPSNYEGDYGAALAARDIAVYGEYLLRDYSHVWLRSPITEITSSTSISSFSGRDNVGRNTTIHSSGEILADNEGPLTKFSLYTFLPKGVTFDLDDGTVSVSGTGTKYYDPENGNPDFANHASYSMRTINGQKVLVTDFDFSDNPIEISKDTRMTVNIPVTLTNADFITNGNTYTAETYLMVHDGGLDRFAGKSLKNDTNDLDQNGSIEDQTAYSYDTENILDNASEWREYAAKFVKSAYSNGYVTDTATRLYSETDSDSLKTKSDYEYRLDFSTGASNAKNIWFFDSIEQGARIAKNKNEPNVYTNIPTEWQGLLKSVDTSHAVSQGLKVKVYYSTSVLDPATFDPKAEHPDTDTSKWTETAPADMSTVKSIAVSLDTSGLDKGVLEAKQMTYVVLKMRAPADTGFIGKKAVNQHFVKYDAYSLTGSAQGTIFLPSSETYVTLYDNIGKLILQKVDADNVLSVKNGVTKYAPLTGAEIRVTNEAGTEVYNGPVNGMGRIVIKAIRTGKYYWEETKAPKGYKKFTGKHEFTVSEDSGVINMENKRIPGNVELTKLDQDHAAYNRVTEHSGQLSGAEFELYNSRNEKVFTTAKSGRGYAYSESGTNTTFVTDASGKIRIAGLPWDVYRFHEIKAPKGYTLGTDVSFIVDRDSVADNDGNQKTIFKSAYDTEKTASIVLTKKDEVSKDLLSGAFYDLYRYDDDSDKTEDHKWVKVNEILRTNAVGEIKVDDLKFGKYRFVETQPPKGYYLNEKDSSVDTTTLETELTPNTAESIVNVEGTDPRKPGSAVLLKTNEEGIALSGAEFSLYKKGSPDTLIQEHITTGKDGETKRIDDLEWGDYYFVETKAPKGYVLDDTKIEFTLDQESVGNSDSVKAAFEGMRENLRTRGSVILTKKAADTKEAIKGTDDAHKAEFMLFKNDGTKVPVILQDDGTYHAAEIAAATDKAAFKVTESDAEYTLTTNAEGAIRIDGLDWGAYYFSETKAPTGYSLSTDNTRFVINEQNCTEVQNVECLDETAMASLIIDKEINDWYEPFGQASFIFEISGTTSTGESRHWNEVITLGQALTGSVTINIPEGTYTVKEKNVARYRLVSITGVSGEVAIDTAANTASVTLQKAAGSDTIPEAEVKFTNETDQYRPFSHNVNTENMIAKEHKISMLRVDYKGPLELNKDTANSDLGTAYTFHESDLTATAVYDDGVEREIPFNELSLDPATIIGSNNTHGAGYEVKVSYTENGDTVSNSFTVTENLPVVNRYTITFDANGGYFGDDPSQTSNSISYIAKNINKGSYIEKAERQGFAFIGWNTAKDGNGTEVIFNEEGIPNIEITKNTTIYAEYAPELLDGGLFSPLKMAILGAAKAGNFTQIRAILRSDTPPDANNMTNAKVISKNESELPVYMWKDGTTLKWYSQAKKVVANNLSYLFMGYSALNPDRTFELLSDISGLSDWATSNVTDMSFMFYECEHLSDLSPLANWDTSNVTSMVEMFDSCNIKDLSAISGWNTSKVTDMGSMFIFCISLQDLSAISGWNTSKVTNMGSMFYHCISLTDSSAINDWDIAKVTSFNNMFQGCPSHPTFTKRAGTWSDGTFTPAA